MNKDLIIISMLCILLAIGAVLWDEESCDQRSVSFSDNKYGIFSGCMVKHNDKWIPLSNIRGIDLK